MPGKKKLTKAEKQAVARRKITRKLEKRLGNSNGGRTNVFGNPTYGGRY